MKFYLILEPLAEKDVTVLLKGMTDMLHLTDIEIRTLACNVFGGLAFIHRQGYFHNDMNPGNTGPAFVPFDAVVLDVGNCVDCKQAATTRSGRTSGSSPNARC